jgi:polyhydroxyalkanoate synthesis repressor PhaR
LGIHRIPTKRWKGSKKTGYAVQVQAGTQPRTAKFGPAELGVAKLDMAKSEGPVTIKKYANRRLYNTGTSTYVTLEDLASMVKAGNDFIVHDAKTGEEITRQVLAQIIFEQENKEGQSLLPIAFLRQLIRFYGNSMQMLVPRYLEVSIDSLTREQEKFREQMAQAFGGGPFGPLEDQVRRNMEIFERTFAMFTPFGRRDGAPDGETTGPQQPAAAGSSATEIDDLKRQMNDMQKRLERLSDKDKT